MLSDTLRGWPLYLAPGTLSYGFGPHGADSVCRGRASQLI